MLLRGGEAEGCPCANNMQPIIFFIFFYWWRASYPSTRIFFPSWYLFYLSYSREVGMISSCKENSPSLILFLLWYWGAQGVGLSQETCTSLPAPILPCSHPSPLHVFDFSTRKLLLTHTHISLCTHMNATFTSSLSHLFHQKIHKFGPSFFVDKIPLCFFALPEKFMFTHDWSISIHFSQNMKICLPQHTSSL